MKGHIVNTPFYTKVNWYDESIFLSMYGQHKSYGEPRSRNTRVEHQLEEQCTQNMALMGRHLLTGKS